MRKVSCLLAVCLLFVIAGCKSGIQVHDNIYDSLGGQVLKVSDDFKYVGECDPTVMVTSGQGRAKANNGITTRGDVFVKEINGQPTEIFIVQRMMITQTGAGWKAVQGDPVKFYGIKYKEGFFDAKKYSHATVESYMNFLNENGYKVDSPDLYVRTMSKNIGRQLQGNMYYGVYPGLIPEDMRGDYEKEKQFIRERFDANVSVIQ